MNRSDIKIEDLLPHRDRMLLIDEILEVDDNMAVTVATVTNSWPLFRDNGVDPLVLIEVFAQTGGINNAWDRIQKFGKESDKSGWLVGIKRARFLVDRLALNDRIITHTENKFEYQGYRQIMGTARVGSAVVGEVELQLIQIESME